MSDKILRDKIDIDSLNSETLQDDEVFESVLADSANGAKVTTEGTIKRNAGKLAVGAAIGGTLIGRAIAKRATKAGRAELRRKSAEKKAAKVQRYQSDLERERAARAAIHQAKSRAVELERERRNKMKKEEYQINESPSSEAMERILKSHFKGRSFGSLSKEEKRTLFNMVDDAVKAKNENVRLDEKSVSKSQQRFFGMVRSAQKGNKATSSEVAKVASSMSKKDVKDFASTKHKGLPEKQENVSEARVSIDARKKDFKETMKRLETRKSKQKEQADRKNTIIIDPVIKENKGYNIVKKYRSKLAERVVNSDDTQKLISDFLFERAFAAYGTDTMHDAHGITDDSQATVLTIARAFKMSPSQVEDLMNQMEGGDGVIQKLPNGAYSYKAENYQYQNDELKESLDVVLDYLHNDGKIELVEFDIRSQLMSALTSNPSAMGSKVKLFGAAAINVVAMIQLAKAIMQKDYAKILTLGPGVITSVMSLIKAINMRQGMQNSDNAFQQRLQQRGYAQ